MTLTSDHTTSCCRLYAAVHCVVNAVHAVATSAHSTVVVRHKVDLEVVAKVVQHHGTDHTHLYTMQHHGTDHTHLYTMCPSLHIVWRMLVLLLSTAVLSSPCCAL